MNRTERTIRTFLRVALLALCVPSALLPAPPAPLRAVPGEGGILVLEGEQKVFFYQRTAKSLDGQFTRANYLHPLYDLDGNVLTEDFPKDHFHHRGVFWAWHQLIAGGRKAGDSWDTKDFAWDVRDVSASVPDRDTLKLVATVQWVSSLEPGGGKPRPLVKETTTITVHRTAGDARKIDFHIRLLALEEGMVIGGSDDEKGYGGFSARIRIPRDVRFTGRSGTVEPQLTALQAGPWVDLSGEFDEPGRVAGVAILTHPSLPEFPPPWILRKRPGMQNVVYPGRRPVPLSASVPTDLRYRLVLHRGDAKEAAIDRLQAEYEKEPPGRRSGSMARAVASDPDARRDEFGGTEAVRTRATGFFRAERIGNRWWLVTPRGRGFVSIGMNHLDLAALKYQDNVHIFRQRYGSSDDRYIRDGIAKPLREWGFNTIGWSREVVGGIWMDPKAPLRHSPEWTPHQFQVAGLPYVYNLEFGEFEGFNLNPHYPDVDSKAFEEWADYQARSACTGLADDPLLIGYADLPIPNFTLDKPGAWAQGLKLNDPADRAKLERTVRRYFEVTAAAIRRYDRNHMIFGPRFDRPPNTPDWIVRIAGEYFDAILCNLYVTPEQVAAAVAEWHRVSGRPVIISDMLYLAPTGILQVSSNAPGYVPDQAARGEAYRKFADEVLRRPFVVGIHWCAFLENRTRKSGLKTFLDKPYTECVARMQEFNLRRLYSTALAGPQ
jgi:hypothetical protein